MLSYVALFLKSIFLCKLILNSLKFIHIYEENTKYILLCYLLSQLKNSNKKHAHSADILITILIRFHFSIDVCVLMLKKIIPYLF